MKRELMRKFAIDLLNEVAEECEKRIYSEPNKEELFGKIAEQLPTIMERIVEESAQPDINH